MNVDYLIGVECGRGPDCGPRFMVNVDYLQVLNGLSLDVAVCQTVAVVSW